MNSSSRRSSVWGIAALFVVAAAAATTPVRAQSAETAQTTQTAQTSQTFAGDVPTLVWLDLGWSENEFYTNAAFQGANGIGVSIDFEDAFDMPGTQGTARGFGSARISKARRYIDFGYVDINRKGSRFLDEDITWGDYTIEQGSDVTADFNTGFIYVAYRYDFLHQEQVHISGSAGLTWINLSTSLSATGSILNPDGTPFAGSYYKKVSTGAPVPMVGLSIDWAIHRRLVVRMYSRFFRLNVSEFNGGLNEAGMRLNWYFVKNFGLGLGYDRTDLNLKELSVGNGEVVSANYSFNGATLFICLAF